MHLKEVSQTKQALGGDVTLAFVTDTSNEVSSQIFHDLWRQVYTFEKRFSRFLPMSELSVFNRSAGVRTFISPEFRDLLIEAKKLSMETGGLYNPFILPALQKAGYIKSAAKGYEDDTQEDYSTRQVVGVENLKIEDNRATIPYGTAIDLGGCGKGYLADQIASSLNKLSVRGYWLSFGGDIATFGYDATDNALTVSIQDTNNLDTTNGWVVHCPTSNFGIATSGINKRKEQKSGNWHHIINPKTLQPAITDVRMATVCASTVLEADVLASCAVILGSTKASEFLKKQGVKSWLLQCANSKNISFERHYGNRIKRLNSKVFHNV